MPPAAARSRLPHDKPHKHERRSRTHRPAFPAQKPFPAHGSPIPTRLPPMNLQELKTKTPAELLNFAEELQIENASSLRKQDMMFAILKQLADNDQAIYGDGVLEVLQDGFGFLRCPGGQLPARPRRHLCEPVARCAASACAPATRSRARSARPRTASAISRCSRSTRSISTIPRSCATASISTI